MRNIEKLSDYEQQLLNQSNIIETIFDHLKHHYQTWHTRHRSVWSAMTYLVAALAAYSDKAFERYQPLNCWLKLSAEVSVIGLLKAT